MKKIVFSLRKSVLMALLTYDVQFKAVVKKKEEQQTFSVDIEVK